MVELRKRKAPPPPPVTEKKSRKSQAPAKQPEDRGSGQADSVDRALNVGDTVSLEGFGGEIEANDGTKTTLRKLVDESDSGVVLFTYPRASTPGCTKQACLFRDHYDQLTSTGLSIYGLSSDSPKSNTTFQTKQSLPYPLLCDTDASLIAEIGFKKQPKGTTRGVFAVDKAGKVLARQAGSPDATVQAVQQLIDDKTGTTGDEEKAGSGEQ
ncbi:hypothetical protein PHISP_00814 [Aspergillus sp. HF37]|nr:hypothetical protein PHISP_00814 [Aspergillus sp. HF37]